MWAWEMLAGRWYELLSRAPGARRPGTLSRPVVAQIMTAGALAVMRRRRAHVAAQRDAAALSPFDSLPLVLLSLTLRTANLMMRDLGNVRLVCHEWTQAIDAHLRSVAHRYCVLAEHTVGAFCSYYQEELAHFNMFAESGWMVDAGTPLTLNTLRFRQLQVFRVCSFPNRSNEDWLFSLLSQLATLPVLEDITIGTEETWLTIEPDMDEDKYFAVLRVLLAQLKRVHTFRGNLGLVDHSRIFLVDAVKALPSLRHIDSERRATSGPRISGSSAQRRRGEEHRLVVSATAGESHVHRERLVLLGAFLSS